MAISCLIISMALFVTHAGRFRRDGMGLWTAGYAVQSFGGALFSTRGMIPDFFSIVLSCTVHSAGFFLLYLAVREFQGKSCRPVRGATAIAIGFFLFMISLRTAVLQIAFSWLIFSIENGAIAFILFRNAPVSERRTRWLTGSPMKARSEREVLSKAYLQLVCRAGIRNA